MPAVPINEEELQARAASVLREELPGSELGSITRLQGGTSSVTYWADYFARVSSLQGRAESRPCGPHADQESRRPPQASLQRALQVTDVPCPQVLAQHPGSPPNFPPSTSCVSRMAKCVGRTHSQSEAIPAEEVRGARELEAAGSLGTLHSYDPLTSGSRGTSRRSLLTDYWSDGDPRSWRATRTFRRPPRVRDLLAAGIPGRIDRP